MKKSFVVSILCVLAAIAAMAGGNQEAPADAMMAKDTGAANFFDLSGQGPGVGYFSGEEETLKQAAADNRKVIYFFAATWCPDCRAAYEDIRKNASSIPEEYRIVFVNYDKEKDLKMKYGVTYQHTFVVPDAMGKAAATWAGTKTTADIIRRARGM